MERAERQPAGLRGSVRAEAPRWAAEQVGDGRPGQGARALCCQRLGGFSLGPRPIPLPGLRGGALWALWTLVPASLVVAVRAMDTRAQRRGCSEDGVWAAGADVLAQL